MAATKNITQVVVDCQVLQTNDRKRGMGFYLKSLMAAAIKSNKADAIKWVFLVNPRLQGLSKEDKDLIQSTDGKILEVGLLHQGDCPVFVDAAAKNRELVDQAMSALLTSGYSKTIFFIPAMYSREIYPVFPTHGTANLMLFYDAIPFLYHQQYFADHEGQERKDYSQRFREFYRADVFAAISQTTADDLAVYFGVDPGRVVSILGAAADRSHVQPQEPKSIPGLADSGFVLMPSGDDFRKNNELAVQAFASLNAKEKLVVTSKFSPGSQQRLKGLCQNIIFAGSVSDAEYLWLVDHAKAIFFPTLYEGLGMPVLEAVERGAKVVCSDIPVFAEISNEAFYGFDPTSVSSISEALNLVLNKNGNDKAWDKKKQKYPNILKRFSWDTSAKLLFEAIDMCRPVEPKRKLAVFCPSPSSYSAIGKYAFELHAEISRYYEVDYFAEMGETEFQPTRPNILEYAANYHPAVDFEPSKAKSYDRVLYHIGNSEFHTESILNSLRLSSTAVVHDTRLSGVFDYMANRQIMPPERREYELQLDRILQTKDTNCLASIVTNQQAVVCHSDFADKALATFAEAGQTKVIRTDLPVGVPDIELPSRTNPIVSFAGIISEDKGIGLVAKISKLEGVKVKVSGFGVLGNSPLLQELGPNVEVKRDLTDKDFQDNLRRSDILINYRINYHGETSLSTLEAMRYGTVVIVRDVGWFSELPDGTVVKVTSEAEVLAAVKSLVGNPELRKNIGIAAKTFLRQQHSYKRYAQKLVEGMVS